MFLVVLSTIEKAKDFNKIVSKHRGNVYLRQGRYVVDGKSIMGLFSLNFLSPITVVVDDNEDNLIKKCKGIGVA